MDLSVIILNYNARVFLELCVASVLRATENLHAEVIVADNDSTDDSVERLLKAFPQVKVIRLDDNYGFAKGNNVAVEQARGTHICLVNPDAIVGEKVFANCLNFFQSKALEVDGETAFLEQSDEEVHTERIRGTKANSQIGFLGIQLIDGKGTYLPESKRRVPTRSGILKKILGFSGSYYDQRLEQNQDGPTEVLVGAFLMGKREVYNRLGGLDERYFMYGEDIDLSFTAIKDGLQNYYLGSQTAIHFKGESTIKDAKYFERFYGAMHLYYEKHYPKGKWLTGLLRYMTRFFKSHDTDVEFIAKKLPTVCVTNDAAYQPDWASRSISFKEFIQEGTSNSKYVFDLGSLELDKLVETLASTSNNQGQYRFLTWNRTAYAGSDTSTERGEVRIL
ncbi:hypothetical protein AAU57_14400 [Nonlabens sp. YIK11]|uniref:glycosyltransferase family 2 protein n=1 Tax=Nonlabens sp. YIK11 TaxID=1453349 RepID=UPI0006DCA3B5|nr:glycosyltransferase family 2 protein [Nonlabens sp. YIK11]KQC34397.1 hypothetical protein AAU57_14400 [Nonlabens sp. YIK11]